MAVYGSVLGLPTEPRERKTKSAIKPRIDEPVVKKLEPPQSVVQESSLIRQRVLRILSMLEAKGPEGLTGSILSFQATGSNSFALETNFAKSKTTLRYDTSGKDEVLRIEMTHSFGHLDLSRADSPLQFLAEMLVQNVPSFRNSGASLGLRSASPYPIVCLNTTHQFLTTMNDDDITEIMSIAIFDLKMGMLFTFPEAVVLWD